MMMQRDREYPRIFVKKKLSSSPMLLSLRRQMRTYGESSQSECMFSLPLLSHFSVKKATV
jgi:hypothetical protein